MKVAYNGETQPLLPNDTIKIKRPRRALSHRETSDDGDRDDHTYIFDDSEHADGLEDDEEPPFQGATKEREDEGESRWQQPSYLQAEICGGCSQWG